MPNTPNFNLPYPGPADAPCDFAEQWCDFTDAVGAMFTGFQTTLNRTVPMIPVALLQAQDLQSVTSGTAVTFDTVLIDTARMTDVDTDPFGITITKTGRYTVGGGLITPTASLPFPPNFVSILVEEPGVPFETWDYNNVSSQADIHMNATIPVTTLTAGQVVQLLFFRGTSGDYPINVAWLGVAWHSDTEVP